jgi:hypothetical protein
VTTTFTVHDLYALSDLVADAWTAAADGDWNVPAGTLEWSCLHTADHAVDTVYAPAFFLASRLQDRYPDAGGDLTMGSEATPPRLVESLGIATRILAAVVNDAEPDARAVLFRNPTIMLGAPPDFVPRAALELALHAHDVGAGLGMPFVPSADLALHLREHTRTWPVWPFFGHELGTSDDAWADLLAASGRAR